MHHSLAKTWIRLLREAVGCFAAETRDAAVRCDVTGFLGLPRSTTCECRAAGTSIAVRCAGCAVRCSLTGVFRTSRTVRCFAVGTFVTVRCDVGF